MMSVKSKYLRSRFNDKYREIWSSDCESFVRLSEICNVISTCVFNEVRGRQKKLTKHTGNAFLITTENNVLAAKVLIEYYKFEYILYVIFSQNPLEKFFGEDRQICGGNFYIDVDVIAASKAQHLHQLLKYDIIPEGEVCAVVDCPLCISEVRCTRFGNSR